MEPAHDALPGDDHLMAQRLGAAFEHLRESIALTDPEDRFVFVNRAFRDLNHNVAQAIAPGQKFEDYLRAGLAAGNYADAIGREQEWLEARLAERRNPSGPVERPRSDGRWFRIHDRRLPDGSTIRFGTEITEERQTRRSLARSEARFRGLTELSSDWYWEQDDQFRQTFLSSGYDGLSGAQRIRTLGTKRWERADVTPLSCSWAEHRAALEAHLPFKDFEYLRDSGEGSRVYVSLSGEPVFDENGRFTGYRGIGRNITARKRDEQLLRIEHQVTRALSEAEDAAAGIRSVLQVVCGALNMGCGRYFQVDEAAGVLRFHDGWCLPEPAYQRHLEHSRTFVFRPGEGLAGIVWQSGEPIWSQDIGRDPRVPDKSLIKNSEIRGVFTFSVLAEGKTIGVLSVSGRAAREPDQRLLEAARVIGIQVGQFLQRIKAEQALRASEERFRGTFELAASGIAHVDLDGRFTRVNRSMCRLLGRSAAELVGSEVRDFSHFDDRDVTVAARKRMRAGEIESEHFEKRFLRKDGTTVWVDLAVALVRDAGGAPEYEIAVFDDITERMDTDAALRAQTERLKIGQAAARMIIMDWDIRTDSITWSDSPEWLRGPLPASGGYPLFRDQVHPEDRARFLAARDAALDSLQGSSQEFRLVRTDGEILWFLSRQRVIADANGKADRMLAALLDITERKRAEQAFADSEARFRAIFERSSVGMAITGIDGGYLSVNAAFARFFGYAIEDLVGRRKVGDLRLEDDIEGEALYRRLIAGEIDLFERDRPYRHRDGAPIWGRATMTAVRDAAGTPLYVVAVMSDVTDEIVARGRIERMNAELEERVETRTTELREAMKELDAFTYSVSHDLRAPIGAVSGFAHLLRSAEAARMTEDGLRLLDFIDQNAERMTRLIEGLLRFSRLGRSDLRRTRVSMNQLAGESLLDYVDESARANVSAGAMPDCEGDPALLGQVWSNLVGNALKYSRGANPPHVDIGWDAGRTAYFVRDNGVGFDMAYVGKLFGVFERLHHESEFEGSGIGLAIAERIVKRHGGAIWAEAAPERGATFWFTVPDSARGAASAIRPSPEKPR